MVNPTDEETKTHQGLETWYNRVPWVWLEQTEKNKVLQFHVGEMNKWTLKHTRIKTFQVLVCVCVWGGVINFSIALPIQGIHAWNFI